MDKMIMELFLIEIKKQCEFVLYSVEMMNEYLINRSITDKQFWYYVQGFLEGTANVSKLLFGASRSSSEDREELREYLGVSEDSIIRNREIRNAFDHYDERIVRWYANSEQKNFVDTTIGPYESIQGVVDSDRFRGYDTKRNVITFRGEELEVQPITDELMRIYNNLLGKEQSHI